MIAKPEFFGLVRAELVPLFEREQFRSVREGFFFRQRGPFLHYLAVGVDRFGEFAHLVACVWVPWMDLGNQNPQKIVLDQLGVQVGGEVSPRALRDTWGWEVGDVERAKVSLRGMALATASFAFPWFDSIATGSAFVDECARNPGYWRKVAQVERTRIRESIDQTLAGELHVGTYGFATTRPKKEEGKIPELRALIEDPTYEEILFDHTSDVAPKLKLSLKGLKKK